MRVARAALLAAVAMVPARALAQDDGPRDLAHDTRIDGAIAATGALWMIVSEVLKPTLVPEKCRWCYRAADGSDTLNPFDKAIREALVWESTHTADVASSVIVFGTEPVSAIGLLVGAAAFDGGISGAPLDVLLMGEAVMVAQTINQVAKFALARERPFVHYLPRAPDGLRELTASPSDDNLSFFSGHSTLAFSIAASSGTLATLRGYRLAPVVWAAGMTQAAVVGYLRIAADKHYFSDVMLGAIVGSAVGIGLPMIFHQPEDEDVEEAASPSPAPATFGLSGAF
jgi:membrane-associated phospholipid phosphatase